MDIINVNGIGSCDCIGDFIYITGYGISFGTALAIAISFNKHRSIIWAIVHGFFGWFYVLYYALFGK
ncbi:MAG: hypothetical protein K0R73_516 [Candidatus Midichloriaceae bacterium]|nr:hypothetical protein [Candidatus Midichloriaceae bacterium]